MRKVDRSKVPVPPCLQNLSIIASSHLLDYSKISNGIYGHADVKLSLQSLYYDKCYICECDVSAGKFHVEHYLPKKHFPQFGYTWNNLHKSCEGCNQAKENSNFFCVDATGNYTDVKLLDPASSSYNVSEYLIFDLESVARPAGIGSDPVILQKADNTISKRNVFIKLRKGTKISAKPASH